MTAFKDIVSAYVVKDKASKFEAQEVPLKSLEPNDVRIEMICSGLCHTDVHMQKNDWGITSYPTVPGHEGVGRIVAVGNGVKGRAVGDKVGVGWISGSCETCLPCVKGEENLCKSGYTGTILGDNAMGGTFAKDMIVPSRFVYGIPEHIPSAIAAPLLCAGITVYSPLRKWVKPNHKVGIISVGGLGHLAIQFARAMGAEVTVFSTSKRKEADARKFGASNFVVFTDKDDLAKAKGEMDVILNTCPYSIDLDAFLDCLANDGVFVYVGLPEAGESELKVNLYKLVFGQKSLVGSIVGGSIMMNEMFELVGKFGLSSSVKLRNFRTINETCDDLIKGKMDGAYRFALCWDNEAELQKEMDDFVKRCK